MRAMHLAIFLGSQDRIYSASMVHKDTKAFSVTVSMCDDRGRSEVAIFADSLSQIADFGRAILAECDQLAVESAKPV